MVFEPLSMNLREVSIVFSKYGCYEVFFFKDLNVNIEEFLSRQEPNLRAFFDWHCRVAGGHKIISQFLCCFLRVFLSPS